MGTRGQSTGFDRVSVFQELFAAIAADCRGVHADKMAAALLRYEQGTRALVGVVADAKRAVFVNTEAGRVVAVSFDKHGVRAVDEMLARGVHDADAWVAVHGETLAWVHPRYRKSD